MILSEAKERKWSKEIPELKQVPITKFLDEGTALKPQSE